MNIYFACSITGGRRDESIYQQIVDALLEDGHVVPTADLAASNVSRLEGAHSPEEVYARDVAWIEACDALVAEVSTPSHGVGYEVAFALNLGKPVLCLYSKGVAVSKMLTGNNRPTLTIQAYQNAGQAINLLRDFLSIHSP